MDKIRPILYGVSDYAEIRRTNAWFVDRTAKIRDLEATRFAMFLRPRRFGKSMLISILQAYYDVRYAARFEELFAGTAIGENPTEEHNQYLILYFNFSVVSKEVAPAAPPPRRSSWRSCVARRPSSWSATPRTTIWRPNGGSPARADTSNSTASSWSSTAETACSAKTLRNYITCL